jgi:hypothetical protein
LPGAGSPHPAWHEVTGLSPCPICGKPDWCARSADGAWAICRRVEVAGGKPKLDKAGAAYWVYRLDGHAARDAPARALPATPAPARADPATLDRVYRALLAALALHAPHRQALHQRGLPDREIAHRGYATLPATGRAALARRLVERFGADVGATVPGLYVHTQGTARWWSLAGAPGLLIPVRDLDGRLVALKVRADPPGARRKYTSISSTKYGGPGPGAPVHVPRHAGLPGDTVRLTEGELKADVATVRSGLLTVSLPGVALWRQALPVLQSCHPQQVVLAFDADWRRTPQVAQALAQTAFALVAAGYVVEVETWDPALGKGIDDVLAAGHTPARQAVALAFGAGVRGRARAWTGRLHTVAAQEVSPWHR